MEVNKKVSHYKIPEEPGWFIPRQPLTNESNYDR